MEYILFYKEQIHGLKMTQLTFSKNAILIADTDDYDANEFDDEGGYWEEYWTINSYDFEKIISRLEKYYKPIKAINLDLRTLSKFEQLENNANAKFLFLYILSINKYQKEISEKEYKNIRGRELVNILCGNEIKYKYKTYSKGP